MAARGKTRQKPKAILILMLICGHEAVRMKEQFVSFEAYADVAFVRQPARERWKEANSKCTWSLQRGCEGEGCTWRKLPLDKSLSDSCRLSNAYMLEHNEPGQHYVNLMADLLDEKSEKFGTTCANEKIGVRPFFSNHALKCARRAGQMLHAQMFLATARHQLGNFSQRMQEQLDMATHRIVSFLGDDAHYVDELVKKVKENWDTVKQDPTDALRSVFVTLARLVSPNEEYKNEARDTIAAKGPIPLTDGNSKLEREMVNAKVKQDLKDTNLDPLGELQELVSNVDTSIASVSNASATSSSLIEHRHSGIKSLAKRVFRFIATICLFTLFVSAFIVMFPVLFGLSTAIAFDVFAPIAVGSFVGGIFFSVLSCDVCRGCIRCEGYGKPKICKKIGKATPKQQRLCTEYYHHQDD